MLGWGWGTGQLQGGGRRCRQAWAEVWKGHPGCRSGSGNTEGQYVRTGQFQEEEGMRTKGAGRQRRRVHVQDMWPEQS